MEDSFQKSLLNLEELVKEIKLPAMEYLKDIVFIPGCFVHNSWRMEILF